MVSFLYSCPAAALAKSLLDVWLSGDHARLRQELDHVSRVSVSFNDEEEGDRVELLKSIAMRMQESPDLFATRDESPRVGVWFDLLHHLSAESSLVN
ncbi:MAG TPA: hypothetical protein VFT60_06235 [Bryobacteraceae bacterium]|jgi:hypothetical protein|nr:hypothetical protein [Bryobacteraceae bacterium]